MHFFPISCYVLLNFRLGEGGPDIIDARNVALSHGSDSVFKFLRGL